MKILLISESSTEDDIYRMIDQIIKIDKIIETHDISEELSYITDIQYDIIIINYDKVRIRNGDFKMIFDIRCKTQAPLLVILEGCEIRDKLHVLNMKADDYIEKPINMDVLDADISINDEATANVAPENEADLMNAVEELTKEKTIIMIAHRLKTVRKADQILVIEKGRIAEQGTHDVLLQKNGIYSSFICSRKEAVSWKVQKHS